MASLGRLVHSVVRLLSRPAEPHARPPVTPAGQEPSGEDQPGRFGPRATVEVDPSRIGPVRMAYSPSTDGNPDPGEIVWTWVPYEERDGRGKDRPVLLVAAGQGDEVMAVALTSKPHGDASSFVSIGRGSWDSQGRPSWVGVERIFRVYPDGMRREAAALDAARFSRVADILTARYGWH
ncbi:type II toxin-antitoxin system PemK/MazF family toxin [Mycetocola miduiensis]|uniref:PemK-like, MazF-like toxin of type II toxin-antitoxin system n=1 Tax=Mycetocola miduiensis TaxID=995034 RepID=A0A1I5CMC8_9MICO|nr:type II toxin-antitoxin system PemK/MazF family toxin [Mycetocola miduiensis]SFN88052.1 PemK-like, MazF-like toxin of type II toxin-antitoxin system [Mycetocola miduiensis]